MVLRPKTLEIIRFVKQILTEYKGVTTREVQQLMMEGIETGKYKLKPNTCNRTNLNDIYHIRYVLKMLKKMGEICYRHPLNKDGISLTHRGGGTWELIE